MIVAHSLGCVAVAHWARAGRRAVRASLLVPPCDVEGQGAPDALRAFAPMPLAPFEFRTVVVASTNDPYLALARAEELATAWGARLHVVEEGGHLNPASGYGSWSAGEALVAELL